MTRHIKLHTFHDGYLDLVGLVANQGKPVHARGRDTYELTDVTFTLEDPTDSLVVKCGRGLNLTVFALEYLQLLGACSTPNLLVAASPRFADFLDGGVAHGAYGVRIGNQLEQVQRKLRQDPGTRQAVITLWDPFLDNQSGMHDYPCTISLGFRLRDGRLDMMVLMRSNDVWLGAAYDVPVFTMLQRSLALSLGVPPGRYTHTAWSLHLYTDDLTKVGALHPPEPSHVRGEICPIGGVNEPVDSIVNRARAILSLTDPITHFTGTDRWYAERVKEVRHAAAADLG